MKPERLLIIKQLLNHPCGVNHKWTVNLAKELLEEVERNIKCTQSKEK